jgi:hypothetical protein
MPLPEFTTVTKPPICSQLCHCPMMDDSNCIDRVQGLSIPCICTAQHCLSQHSRGSAHAAVHMQRCRGSTHAAVHMQRSRGSTHAAQQQQYSAHLHAVDRSSRTALQQPPDLSTARLELRRYRSSGKRGGRATASKQTCHHPIIRPRHHCQMGSTGRTSIKTQTT